MDNSTLALKYRPTKLADLIGQDSVAVTLTNAFKEKRLYQGFVFAGNYGTGKTSAARILAAMENCENGPTLEPCGTCKMCRDIFAGESTDVREINAASNNGIDDIRNIADFIGSKPLLARVKYVTLDECHALSRQAVESALKVLEEPPEDVRFVLCTTDIHKMKGTIQSRCMPFRFVKVSWPMIAEHLGRIAKKENIQIDEDALKVTAKLADGSVRNALRNLQLVYNFSGNVAITAEMAQKALGAVDDSNYFTIVDSILDKNVVAGMKAIQSILIKGVDIEQVLSGLTEHLRTLMVLTSCNNVSGLLYLSEEEKKRYIHQIGRMSIYVVLDLLALLHQVNRDIALNVNAQCLMEEFLIKSMIAISDREKAASK